MQPFSAALRFTAQCYKGFAVICLIVHIVHADMCDSLLSCDWQLPTASGVCQISFREGGGLPS